jgi:polyphosphate kinase 2 (PPK2 family)
MSMDRPVTQRVVKPVAMGFNQGVDKGLAKTLAARCAFDNVDMSDFYAVSSLGGKGLAGLTAARAAGYALAPIQAQLNACQVQLWREQTQSLLVIIQATDAAGKDSIIRHVFSGLNPAGVRVAAFKQPTPAESAQYYLTRYVKELPARGCISVFNRSYYEDLIMPLAYPATLALTAAEAKRLVKRRAQEVVAWERALIAERVAVIKFYLNVSKLEQARRLIDRIDSPHKRYKFALADVRAHRDYAKLHTVSTAVLQRTHTPTTPWYVIPADHKPLARWLMASILVQHLAKQLAEPVSSATQQTRKATTKASWANATLPPDWLEARRELQSFLKASAR